MLKILFCMFAFSGIGKLTCRELFSVEFEIIKNYLRRNFYFPTRAYECIYYNYS